MRFLYLQVTEPTADAAGTSEYDTYRETGKVNSFMTFMTVSHLTRVSILIIVSLDLK